VLSDGAFTWADWEAQPLDGWEEIDQPKERFVTRTIDYPVWGAWMNLRKWLDDADIRANDSEYAANLKSALRYLLGLIEYEEKVIGWIAEWRQLDRRELAPTTSVTKGWSGLGVDGDDAKELIEFLRNRVWCVI
jgi:hypothetical protein